MAGDGVAVVLCVDVGGTPDQDAQVALGHASTVSFGGGVAERDVLHGASWRGTVGARAAGSGRVPSSLPRTGGAGQRTRVAKATKLLSQCPVQAL